MFKQKRQIILFIIIYIFSYLLNTFFFIDFNKIKAEDSIDSTNLVAVLVDKNIYNSLSSEIQRYSTQYIQKEISNSKAIVLQIDTQKLQAQDILKILENMYFDGLELETSKLIGLVLIGDIPLPVIKNENFIYPSIYPYVDFEEQKFIRNDKEQYFVYNNNPKGSAEIWHSIIDHKQDINQYKDFFDKLGNYYQDPADFVSKDIWYDDFVANKNYFNEDALSSYINNFIFSEDIGYHRFTNLLLKIVQGEHNDEISELLSGFDGQQDFQQLEENKAPTKMLQKMLKESFLKEYDELMSQKQLSRMRDNIHSAGRWIEDYTGSNGEQLDRISFDSHYQKILQKDDVILRYNADLYPTIIEFNNLLEKGVDKQIEDEKYYMTLPMLVQYQEYKDKKKLVPSIPPKRKCIPEIDNTYKNYYFGKSAEYISSIEDTSIYRGTFRNLYSIDGLDMDDIQSSSNPSTDLDIDLNLKSIGASFDIFSNQVQGNRGFNIFNSAAEFELYSGTKVHENRNVKCDKRYFPFFNIGIDRLCKKKVREGDGDCNLSDPEEQADCESPEQFAQRNRGGASPLNLNTGKLENSVYELNNFQAQSAWLPIYDIAGSMSITGSQSEANSFLGIEKYASLTKIQDRYGELKYPIYHTSYIGKSFFDIYGVSTKNWIDGSFIYLQIGADKSCGNDRKKYKYKLIDSRYKNTTIKPEQVDGFDYDKFGDQNYLKKYYDYISLDISTLYNTIYQQKSEFVPNITGSINNNLLGINIQTNDIISGLNQIINYNLSNIGNQTLISSGWLNITSGSINTIDQLASQAITGLLNTDNILNTISTNNIEYYILKLKQEALFKGEQVQFLSGWTQFLNSQFTSVQNLFNGLQSDFQLALNTYNSINTGDLSTKISQLQQKRNDIDNLQLCGLTACGCTNNYAILCNSINQTILNINSIKDSIETISYFQEYEGGSWIDIKPFEYIQDSFSGNNISQDLTLSLNTINGFQIINDTSNIPKIHFPGMNITTQDRPIDSPRYITFQGLSGSVVKLIYPNLYKVEVFTQTGDLLILKKPEQIQEAIKDYLQETIIKYNQELKDELDNKQKLFNKNPNAYSKLQTLDTTASPNRSYQLFDEDYLINILGEEHIETLSKILYYHNITNQERKIGSTIQEDIENTKSSFDINEKISDIMSNYLKQDNDQGGLVTPSYNPDGYEVGFLNSDGLDYISTNSIPSFIQQIQSSKENFEENNQNNQLPQQQTEFEEELNTECGINDDGTALLIDLSDFSSPWVKAFGCWLKKTLDKPFELSITFPFSTSPIIGDFETIQQGEDQLEMFGSQRSQLNPTEQNQNTIANTPSDEDAIKLQNMLGYIQTKTDKTTINLQNNTGKLEILSTKDLGNMDIYISSTGDDCLKSNGKSTDLCENPIKLTSINPYGNNQNIDIQTKDNKAGTTIITFDICIPNSENCVKKTQQISIIPSDIQQVQIFSPDNKIMLGSQMPIIVNGLDQYGNNVGQILKNFFISVSQGEISDGTARGSTIRFNSFKDPFIYFAPGEQTDINIVDIKITGENTSISANKTITLVRGYPHMKYLTSTIYQETSNSIITGKISISLPENTEYYHFTDQFGIKQVNQNTLPKITLEIKDSSGKIIDIDTVVNIKSKKNVVRIGEIGYRTRTIQTGGNVIDVQQLGFYGQNDLQIQSGKLDIYLYPNFKAGDDTISLDIPGIDTIDIPITIKSGPAKEIILETNKDSLGTEKYFSGSIKITDARGNLYTDPLNIKLGTIGPVSAILYPSNPQLIQVNSGILDFNLKTKDRGGLGYIFAYIDGVNLNDQSPGYKNIIVQKSIIPTEKLNIMYLNLFGTDRGNQRGYFSDNKNFIQDIMAGSEKLLATTTLLVDPNKLEKIELILDQSGQIQNNENNEINLSYENGKLTTQIQGIGSISRTNQNFDIIQIENDEENLEQDLSSLLFENNSKNTFYYIAEDTDDSIQENKVIQNNIIINSRDIFDTFGKIDDQTKITLSDQKLLNLNIREVYYQDVLVGRLLLHIGENLIIDQDTIKAEINLSDIKYKNNLIFANGSTNGLKGIGIFTQDYNFPENSKGYESIEDSIDPTLNIGFRGDFKNITLFGGGENVGESTKDFSSEFLINFGDPLVKRIDKNKEVSLTDFDGSIGKSIYSDPNKTIFKVKTMDFNNDGLKDILISYTDGTIKLLKNYGGDDPYRNMQELAILADGIKEIYIGDVDGNNYDDIIILTKGNQLRIYTNQIGIFDVDGYVVCLNTKVKLGEKSTNPQDLEGVEQLFIQDMNKDGKIDIVTNDKKGFIKIFYGGNNNTQNYANYVSKLKYTCDDERYSRQSVNENTKIVKRFGIKLDSQTKILDNSLIHRQGLEKPDPDDIYNNVDMEDIGIDIDTQQLNDYLENTDPEDIDQDTLISMVGPSNFNTNQMIGVGAENMLKYVSDPIGISPIYENLTGDDLVFIPLGYLSGNDPVSVYKNYEDINGDILEDQDLVKVSVTIKANQNFLGTFIDKIQGPWEIKMHDEGHIKHFWFKTGTDISDIKMNREVNNGYTYMLDNLDIKNGDYIQFYYRLNYKAGESIKIDVKDIDGKDYKYKDSNPFQQYTIDGYPDISIKPTDGCSKFMTVFFNTHGNNGKNYNEEFIDLQKIMQEYLQEQEEKSQDTMSEITDIIGNSSTEADISNTIGSDTFETFDVNELLGQMTNGGANINLGFLDDMTAGINEKIDEALNGLCKGFKLGGDGCGGLPIPFNQAFLAPGQYHLFGCYNLAPVNTLLGGGVPMLFFPGTLQTPVGPIPMVGNGFIPVVQKGAGDDFKFSAPGGTIPSQFRLYIAPTLTMQVGIAMCMGPYAAGINLPKPFRDIGGNCVVVAIPIPLPCGDKKNSSTDGDQYPQRMNEIGGDGNACNSSIGPNATNDGYAPSPFQLVSTSQSNTNPQAVVQQGSYAFGFIQIDKDPISIEETNTQGIEVEIGGVKLQGGENIKNKIKGGTIQGLKKIIINNRLDKQIKYIMNNLTKMDIKIYLPEIDKLFEGVSDLGEKDDELQKDNCKEQGGSRDQANNKCISKKQTICESQGGTWVDTTQQCTVEDKTKENNIKKEYCKLEGRQRNSTDNLCQIPSTLQKLKENKGIQKGQLKGLSESLSNPFEYIGGLFSDVSLVKINTKNINIKVPMIYSEDILAYGNYLNQRKTTNLGEKDANGELIKKGIIHKWTDLINGAIGMCAMDLGKIDTKQNVKEKYTEVKKQLIDEGKGLLDNFDEALNSINLDKSNPDYGIVLKCQTQFKIIDTLKSLSKILFDKSKEEFTNENKNKIETLVNKCNIDQSKIDQNSDLEGKYKEAKKQIDDKEKELKKNLPDGYQASSEEFLTGSKILNCLEAFGNTDFDSILDNFLSLQDNSATMETAIRQNIKTLEQYKKLPLEMYEWIHIQDKYLSEISSLINNFVGKIVYWINTNANRYSQYIDSIITLIGIVNTYQILIDFSVNRSESCGKCTNDTYDSYSCSLSMLCPDVGLPILPIPPFKIPNIIIDLSNINLGIDILLPNFKFTPTKVPLIQIPNLPEPPKINANISVEDQLKVGLDLIGSISKSLSFLKDLNIPSIPQLPQPPQLPEPPSFLPNVQLELPVLPPAPKLPKLPNELKATLKTAEVIGKILCIVKGGIGLVGEKGVKAKIEQLTQRSYEVPFFDFMDLTTKFQSPPLKGFDYEISSYVNLQYNFDGVFSILNGIASEINKYSTAFESVTEKTVGEITKELNNNAVTDSFGDIQGFGSNTNINVNGSGIKLNYIDTDKDTDEDLIDHQEAKKQLIDGLAYFKQINKNSNTDKEIDEILNNLKETPAKGEILQIQNIQKEAQEIIKTQREENIKIANNIKSDYDGFIRTLEKNGAILASNQEVSKDFRSDLFSIPQE
ncbi:VCBS repeat-containing protein, partial [Candidatus Gracilibacteria bacterium]|nr:VCBS repeat-containing protein [Candidatus Gracilibacteria bacterium]